MASASSSSLSLNLLHTTTPPLPPSSTQLHSLSFTSSFSSKPNNLKLTKHSSVAAASAAAALSDPFVLQIAETFEDSLSTTTTSPSPVLQSLRLSSSEALLSLTWPSKKDENFRFTDTSFIKTSQIHPVSSPNIKKIQSLQVLPNTHMANLVLLDGYVVDSLSSLSGLPEEVFVGSLSNVSSEGILKRVSEFLAEFDGDLFWSLNGVGAPELVLVYVPEGVKVECPVYLRYCSVEGSVSGSNTLPVSSPRVLVIVEKGGEVGLVEEYVGGGDEGLCYWTNAVLEVVICEGGSFGHTYIQSQSLAAAHTKWTSVRQETASMYKLVEVSSGGRLSRHNLHVKQVGPDTTTELSTLHLSVNDQTQDLHSQLILDHPRGCSRQLHKCIVGHARGQAVFDGNVRVNRYAQQTDAGQLTRSLLLVPQATVNVKPNLQIIADDVKCSHGAAISDLEEHQLFYFQARGIDKQTAKKALTYSFGAEVLDRIPYASVREKAKNEIADLLTSSLTSLDP